jgi:hypothetical protein
MESPDLTDVKMVNCNQLGGFSIAGISRHQLKTNVSYRHRDNHLEMEVFFFIEYSLKIYLFAFLVEKNQTYQKKISVHHANDA